MTNSHLPTKTFHNVQTHCQQNEQAYPVCQIDQIFIEKSRQNKWQWQQQRIGKQPWQKPVAFCQTVNEVSHG